MGDSNTNENNSKNSGQNSVNSQNQANTGAGQNVTNNSANNQNISVIPVMKSSSNPNVDKTAMGINSGMSQSN